MTTVLVAGLNSKGWLIGKKRKRKISDDDVVLPDDCDLPTNGTYKWTGSKFEPLGHGFPPIVSRPPVTEAQALFAVIEKLGGNCPPNARAWADWYDANLRAREEEMSLRHRTPKITR